MELITKSQPSNTVIFPYVKHTHMQWDDGRTYDDTINGRPKVTNGSNTIIYESGPRYLYRLDGSRVPNWKWCDHSQRTTTSIQPYAWKAFRRDDYNRLTTNQDGIYYPGCKTNWLGAFSFPTMPVRPDLQGAASQVWDKIALRANDSYFLLEDVAGFLSGKSLWSAIKGVASGTQMLARTVSQLKRVRRHFGARESLYQLWQSAREELCRIIGLRLGYRFSFKTTLHDVELTSGFVDGFHVYLQQLQNRTRMTLPYSATVTNKNTIVSYLPSGNVPNHFGPTFQDSGLYWIPFPPAPVTRESVQSCTVTAHASVRYTMNRATVARYLQRQFGLDRPLSTLWAIVPLSFLIDYLVPVQDMLSYVDNWLNDFDISTTFESAWAIQHSFQRLTVGFPGFSAQQTGKSFTGSGAKCVVTKSSDFKRFPISTTLIRDQFPPLISAGDNWYRRLGTGFEILTQLRHR